MFFGARVRQRIGEQLAEFAGRRDRSECIEECGEGGEHFACIEPEQTNQLGTCTWRGSGAWSRTQKYFQIRLVSAQTGVVLNQGIVYGSMPRSCASYYGSRPTSTTFAGGSPGSFEVGNYLDPLLGQ
jgi:Tfp pilus assembly protein PilX